MFTAYAPRHAPSTRVVHIAAECGSLTAELTVPRKPVGIIVFARTNAAHRQARYDQRLAERLQATGFATLLLNLLTPAEELVDAATCAMRADLALVARRLIEVIDWLDDRTELIGLDVGIVGEDIGAAAAFVAACVRPRRVAAIVSYAESLDLAGPVLARVHVPSLLIVAGNDEDNIRSNNAAFRKLECGKELVRVAVDRFTTRIALDDEVSRLAHDWLSRMMSPVLAH
jgi:dienelactone hydrolase